MSFESGIKRYIVAQAVVETKFPVDWNDREHVACKHCNFFVRATQRCGLNQQIVNFPDNYVGAECPLEVIENV